MARKILSLGNATRLLLGRNDALAMAGYAVVSPRTPEKAPALLATYDFFAVVMGHSLGLP
jgi:hypothetical protein